MNSINSFCMLCHQHDQRLSSDFPIYVIDLKRLNDKKENLVLEAHRTLCR